jgi:hypothetical protein
LVFVLTACSSSDGMINSQLSDFGFGNTKDKSHSDCQGVCQQSPFKSKEDVQTNSELELNQRKAPDYDQQALPDLPSQERPKLLVPDQRLDKIQQKSAPESEQKPKDEIDSISKPEKEHEEQPIEQKELTAPEPFHELTKTPFPEITELLAPALPKMNPDFKAPPSLRHPLQGSEHVNFMIGQDDKGNYLYAEGGIGPGTFNRFKQYVNHYEKQGIKLDRFMMHSPGGMLAEGINIGHYIKKNSWSTDADSAMRCYSACAMIYAAGNEKRIQQGAEIGFHRPYIPEKPDTAEFVAQVYQDYISYWSYVGGDKALYDEFMLNYGRDEMLILDANNIQEHFKVEQY